MNDKVTGALRVKNEARWIEQVIRSIQPLCEEIIVFDDHSTDETPEICTALGASVLLSTFTGLNEARDKAYLLEWVRACAPDWCLMIDGDEILESAGPAKIRAAIAHAETVASITLRVRYLWDSIDQERVDGIFGKFKRPSLFRVNSQPAHARFSLRGHGANFHCGNVPAGLAGRQMDLDVSLLHMGYLHAEDRMRKFSFYSRNDPGNIAEDCYRHIVIGDLYPETSKFRHGGPLELQPFQDARIGLQVFVLAPGVIAGRAECM